MATQQEIDAVKSAYYESTGIKPDDGRIPNPPPPVETGDSQMNNVKQAYAEYSMFGGDDPPKPATEETTQTTEIAKTSDDAGSETTPVSSTVNTASQGWVTPQPNILSNYASYTYQLTWYLLTMDQYNNLVSTGNRMAASTWQILVQTGGASVGNAPDISTAAGYSTFMNDTLGNQAQAGVTGIRNKYFNLDYYIDELEIESVCPGKGTSMCHMASKMAFYVTEPMGVTLITNLYNAVQDLYKKDNGGKSVNYPMAMYCLGIRFYGYDDQGNLTRVGKNGAQGQAGLSDPGAIVEKYYPFIITNITFRMTNGAVKYKVEATPQGQFYNASTDRGSIPFNMELTGTTIKDILVSGGSGQTGQTSQAGVDSQSTGDKTQTTEGREKDAKAQPPAPAKAPPQGILSGGNGGETSTEALGLGVDY